jgi:hypothetical protein
MGKNNSLTTVPLSKINSLSSKKVFAISRLREIYNKINNNVEKFAILDFIRKTVDVLEKE